MRRPAPRAPDGDDDAPWTDDDIKGLVRVLVGMPLDEEGQRKLVEHVRLERAARTRKQFLDERRRQGRVRCDACAEDLAQKYGATFSEVVEVHHRLALWKGVQRATGDMLALLCPTCHRVVHYRQREPRAVEEVAGLVGRRR
jgi:predicted HNH restriction endonuclease